MRRRNGFTFIEILVVVVIIGVLAGIMSVSYVSAGKFTRDSRRKKDLANVRAALELYKVQNGEYPDSSTCPGGAGWTWPGCVSPQWIPGLDDEYMSELPTDPKGGTTAFIANDSTGGTPRYTYNYRRLTATTYQLLARMENVDDPMINGEEYGFTGEGIYVLVEPK